jgi:hypothetical protein
VGLGVTVVLDCCDAAIYATFTWPNAHSGDNEDLVAFEHYELVGSRRAWENFNEHNLENKGSGS